MRIGMTYDLKADWKLNDGDPHDLNAELDSPETVEFIAAALEWGGHEVVRIGNARDLLRKIGNLDVDFIFNICEGRSGRNRESEVPVILEMYGIPFLGADGLTLGVTLDKVMAKKCFIADGIPTPRYFVAEDSKNLKELNAIGFPLLVKPRGEGTSKGLTEQSRVKDWNGLKQQVELINQKYHQPALVEEFIEGTEFTVAVVGNNPPKAMPVCQVQIDGRTDLGEKFFTFAHVSGPDTAVKYVCPANIPEESQKLLQDLAVRVFKSVGCRDIGRIDFRMDRQGNAYALEINPLPSLAKKDVFNLFPYKIGSSYQEIVNQVVDYAGERYGLNGGSRAGRSAAAASSQ